MRLVNGDACWHTNAKVCVSLVSASTVLAELFLRGNSLRTTRATRVDTPASRLVDDDAVASG